MRGRPASGRPLKVKMISPAKTAADSVHWRSIKYSLFPPLGLATLAGYLDPDDEVDLQDEHVEKPKSANDAGLQLSGLGSHGASRLNSRSHRYTVGRGVPAPRAQTAEEVTMGFMDKAKQMAEEAAAKAKQGAADLGEKAKEKLSK